MEKQSQPSFEQIIEWLKANGTEENREGMARFGITAKLSYGVGNTQLRKQKTTWKLKRNQTLAEELYAHGAQETKFLACLLVEKHFIDEQTLQLWVEQIENWAQCDHFCAEVLSLLSPVAMQELSLRWIADEREFIRRAGFVWPTVAVMHTKEVSNHYFDVYWPLCEHYATDERIYVKKAISWLMRNVGKRRLVLAETQIIPLAERLLTLKSTSAKWIARDVLKELNQKLGL